MDEHNTKHNMENVQSINSSNIDNEDTDTLSPDNLESDSKNHDTKNTANVNDQCIPMKTKHSDHLMAYHCIQVNQ